MTGQLKILCLLIKVVILQINQYEKQDLMMVHNGNIDLSTQKNQINSFSFYV